ncbi:MAG: energy transducer TonB [Nitrospirae bacterium]|nr:energy transducer TonB [Nitrospirota bacterium]
MIWGLGFLLAPLNPPLQKPIYAQLIEVKPPTFLPTHPPAVIKPPPPTPKSELKHQTKRILRHEPTARASTPSSPVAALSATDSYSNDNAVFNTDQYNDNVGGKEVHDIEANAGGTPSKVPVTPPQYGAAYLDNPKPAYPASAKRMAMTGTVLLKVLVSREGAALKVETVHSSGHEILDKAAYEAVIKWHFIPARQADTAVEEWVQIPIVFRLNQRS